MPSYKIKSKYALPKNNERIVYKLVMDKKKVKPPIIIKPVTEQITQRTMNLNDSAWLY